MTRDANAALYRQWIEGFWNQGDLSVADALHAPAFAAGPLLKQFVPAFRAAFPDHRFTIEAVVATEDTVVGRWSGTGTHSGLYQLRHRGIDWRLPPTGVRMQWSGIDWLTVRTGRIVQLWTCDDWLGLYQQLGALPAPRREAP